MLKTNYIRCHGSQNRFLMLDAVRQPELLDLAQMPALVAALCRCQEACDGLLLTFREGEHYGMRMFNTDGSEAEMCGNGIRCVARMAQDYLGEQTHFELLSGGRLHGVVHDRPIFGSIPTYRITIGIRLTSPDFTPTEPTADGWIARPIPELDETLRFTYLNLGNPHLVAEVETIDLQRLTDLGQRVKQLPHLFPHGINVSLFRHTADQEIYTATYERGVGLTSSCGTAMTACSTASCLLGLCRTEQQIRVRNSGGMVHCCCHRTEGRLETDLSGNATYYAAGELAIDPAKQQICSMKQTTLFDEEIAQYELFYQSVQ
ncbi:MAG: diaminopimelate epimerase [Rikenellaceae bacterium]|nr:diaminopimelate epimerase [Rikenellaceae bacterium]